MCFCIVQYNIMDMISASWAGKKAHWNQFHLVTWPFALYRGLWTPSFRCLSPPLFLSFLFGYTFIRSTLDFFDFQQHWRVFLVDFSIAYKPICWLTDTYALKHLHGIEFFCSLFGPETISITQSYELCITTIPVLKSSVAVHLILPTKLCHLQDTQLNTKIISSIPFECGIIRQPKIV